MTSKSPANNPTDLDRSPLRILLALARPYRRQFAFITLLAALSTTAGLIEPVVYRMAINDVAGIFVERTHEGTPPKAGAKKRDTTQRHRRGHVAPRTVDQAFHTLLLSVALLLLTSVVASLLAVLAENASARIGNHVERDLISATFDRVLRLRLNFFGERASAVIAKQIDQTDQVVPIVSAFTREIAPEAIRLVGVLTIMLTQSPPLALLAMTTLPAYLWLALRSSRRLESNLAGYYELWEEFSARIQQALGAIKTVKLAGAEAMESRQLREASELAYRAALERTRLSNRYYMLQGLLAQFGRALVLGYGGWKVLGHQLTPGDIVMFVAYLDQLYEPIDSLASMHTTIQQELASLRRAFRLQNAGPLEPSGKPLSPGPGRVEVRDVSFAYVPGRPVLQGVSFTLEPGSVTGLVGPSGAGKTTLADLLLRFYEPTAGTILIDGQRLDELDPAAIRRAISVVAADGAILRGTIHDNISYQRPEANDFEVHRAAFAAGLGRTLERLPEGLETTIGEGGVGLSVGERQRILIARALLAQPRILVLDEATANLDYATESEVKAALDELRRQRTTLIIAHRYSMVRDADHVIVIDSGRIVEQGPPDRLLAAGGWFTHLANAADHENRAENGTLVTTSG